MAATAYSTFSVASVRVSKHAARLTVSQPPLNLVNEGAGYCAKGAGLLERRPRYLDLAFGFAHCLRKVSELIGPGRAMEVMLASRTVGHKEAEKLGLVNRATDNEQYLREFVDDLAARIALWPRGGIAGTKESVQECLEGMGSMQKDMQRLGKLAHTEEAQKAVSGFIERGDHHKSKNAFELGLPDTCDEVWRD